MPDTLDDSQSEIPDLVIKGESKPDHKISGLQLAIMVKAQHMCEDFILFEDPFPTTQWDLLLRVDAW